MDALWVRFACLGPISAPESSNPTKTGTASRGWARRLELAAVNLAYPWVPGGGLFQPKDPKSVEKSVASRYRRICGAQLHAPNHHKHQLQLLVLKSRAKQAIFVSMIFKKT